MTGQADSLSKDQPGTLQGAVSMPVLPTLDKMPRGEMDPSMFSQRDPVVDALGKTGMDKGPVRANGIVRPSSTLIMQIG